MVLTRQPKTKIMKDLTRENPEVEECPIYVEDTVRDVKVRFGLSTDEFITDLANNRFSEGCSLFAYVTLDDARSVIIGIDLEFLRMKPRPAQSLTNHRDGAKTIFGNVIWERGRPRAAKAVEMVPISQTEKRVPERRGHARKTQKPQNGIELELREGMAILQSEWGSRQQCDKETTAWALGPNRIHETSHFQRAGTGRPTSYPATASGSAGSPLEEEAIIQDQYLTH
jgi:hypothetical protein